MSLLSWIRRVMTSAFNPLQSPLREPMQPIGPQRKPLSWIAYEEYCERLEPGKEHPPFEALPEDVQIAWRAAACQVWAESILNYADWRYF